MAVTVTVSAANLTYYICICYQVPSHLFEYFARSPEVVRTWARHYRTGESLPSGLLESVLARRGDQSALELQSQILFSAADQVSTVYIFILPLLLIIISIVNIDTSLFSSLDSIIMLIVHIRTDCFEIYPRIATRGSILACGSRSV